MSEEQKLIPIPTCHNLNLWLEGKRLHGALSLELKWDIEQKDDLRLKGTLVLRKMNSPEAQEQATAAGVPLTRAELPLKRETIPVYVKAMRFSIISGVDVPQLNLGSLGPAVVTEDPAE
jgi:hypothetical protein